MSSTGAQLCSHQANTFVLLIQPKELRLEAQDAGSVFFLGPIANNYRRTSRGSSAGASQMRATSWQH